MNNPLPEMGTVVAESTVKALSPTRSTYYLPVSIATVAVCWVSEEVGGVAWWLCSIVIFGTLSSLTYFAWSARISLRGAAYADELRLARAIALSSAIITLVLTVVQVQHAFIPLAVHLGACSLQIVAFVGATWVDRVRDNAASRFNAIQLTLILSALLGGGAFSLQAYVGAHNNLEHAEMRADSMVRDAQEHPDFMLPGGRTMQDAVDDEKRDMDMAQMRVQRYRLLAVAFYALWLASGLAWFRARDRQAKNA